MIRKGIISLCLFVFAMPLFAQSTADYSWRLGDIDNNGVVDADDVEELTDIVLNNRVVYITSNTGIITGDSPTVTVSQYLLGDINGDGYVDIVDIVGLTDIILNNRFLYLRSNSAITLAQPSTCSKYEYVDLGLSVKWATQNIGALRPEDNGCYFAWAESSAYGEQPSSYPTSWTGSTNTKYAGLSTKTDYSRETYKWIASYRVTKYCTNSSYGTEDNLTTINPDDDAAQVRWQSDWRMPTFIEWGELRFYCYWLWTTNYKGSGKSGYIVYKAKDAADKGKVNTTPTASYSLDDTHIFLPVTGHYYGKTLTNPNTMGYYWSSSLKTSSPYDAYYLYFSSSTCYREYFGREYGYPIRPVCP